MSALCLHILESDSSSTQIPAETVSRLGKTKARGLFMQRGTSPSRGAHDYRRVCALNANAAAPGPSHTAPHARAGRQRGEGCGKPGPAARPGGAGEPGGPRCPAPPRTEGGMIYLFTCSPGRAVPELREGPAPSAPPAPRPLAKPSRPPRETAPPHQGSCCRRAPARRPPCSPPRNGGSADRRPARPGSPPLSLPLKTQQ